MLFAFSQLGTHAGRRVETADAKGGGPHALDQRTLGHQLRFNLVVIVHAHEWGYAGWMSRRREGADHLLHLPRLDQRPDVYLLTLTPGVVGDAGKVFGALAMQR